MFLVLSILLATVYCPHSGREVNAVHGDSDLCFQDVI